MTEPEAELGRMELEERPMEQPQFSVFIAASLDGFIAGPGGDLEFLKAVESPGEDYGYAKFFASVDALLMGRGTYDKVISFPEWLYGDKPVFVATRRPAAPRHSETFVQGTPNELAEKLRAAGLRRIYLDGGNLIRQFLEAGLVADLTLSIIPVLLGSGISLFSPGSGLHALTLEGSEGFSSGLVQLRYRVDPSPTRAPAR